VELHDVSTDSRCCGRDLLDVLVTENRDVSYFLSGGLKNGSRGRFVNAAWTVGEDHAHVRRSKPRCVVRIGGSGHPAELDARFSATAHVKSS
jgi:hypothetical protein